MRGPFKEAGCSATPRRSLTHRALLDLGRRLEELEAYRAAHGTYNVPRAGEHAELGDWLDKLRETYAKRPDGHRIRCVVEHAPALHAYLMAWHATRLPRAACRAVPFWISACWAFDFMRAHARAPSQASSDMSEVAQARWLSRWASPTALDQLARRPFRKTVAEELSAIAHHLRSAPPSSPGMVLPPELALQFLQSYDTLAALASEEVQPCATGLTFQRAPCCPRSCPAAHGSGPAGPNGWRSQNANRERGAAATCFASWLAPGQAALSNRRPVIRWAQSRPLS